MTVSIVLKKKTDTGPQPLYLRIAHKENRRYISLDLKVYRSKWNPNKQRVRRSHPEASRINSFLDRTMATANEVVTVVRTKGGILDAAHVKERIQDALNDENATDPSQDFLAFVEYELEQYERRGQYGTHKNKQSVFRKFREFYEKEYGRERLPFSMVDARLFRRFRTFCYEVRGNAVNTVGKALSVMRTFVRMAMKEGEIDRNDYPFEHLTIDSERVTKDKLTPEQVKRLGSVETRTPLEAEVQRWFMWAYYLGGLRFGDVAALQRKHIKDDRVFIQTEKTGESVGIPIEKNAQEILDHYDNRSKDPEAWVFPILDGVRPGESWKRQRKRRKESRNAKANEILKVLAGRAGINQHVTFHLSRNAALWRLYEKTNDIYKVSKIAGHASVSQTEEYLEGFEDDSLFDGLSDL